MREPKDVTLLIVDDEAPLRKALVFDFKRKGFRVLEADNGKNAFELIKSQKIDVILTDVRMPNGDGVELLDKVKALNPELPVVMFITGYSDISIEDAHDKGADAIFTKPFDRKALMAAVLRAISTKEENWGAKISENIEVDFKIELKLPELNLSAEGRVLNIGRGGMFVALEGNFPMVMTKTTFSIYFNQGEIKTIEGAGVVRWIRTQASSFQRQGCGIEFEYLDDQCRKMIIKFIDQQKMKAFIPKN